MGVQHFSDLVVWQLAEELRARVHDATTQERLQRNFRLVDQLRGSCSSVGANIAEGFGRYGHPEFARFLAIAKGSLDETEHHLHAAHRARYLTDQDYLELHRLAIRTSCALLKLLRHLRTTAAPPPFANS